MNKFLETDKYQWYGFGVIRDIVRGMPWESSGIFPRVSICDFTVRQVANIQKYSVQCVLVSYFKYCFFESTKAVTAKISQLTKKHPL